MTAVNSRWVDCAALLRRGSGASILIKLMMAVNDLALADDALGSWNKEQPDLRKNRQAGARMYFVRLQMAHLVEAMTAVEEFKKDPSLMNALSKMRYANSGSLQQAG
jgi:hypothetical protein